MGEITQYVPFIDKRGIRYVELNAVIAFVARAGFHEVADALAKLNR